MNICIGIISYLPDEEDKRNRRLEKLSHLIKSCNRLFNLPILIVCQNWKNIKINNELYKNVNEYHYNNKLGITGARKELRRIFIESEYDYVIMLDDDSEVSGSNDDAAIYLSQIRNNPDCWGAYKESLLKLFAISKTLFKEFDYPDGEAEYGDFFEDMYMVKGLRKKFPDKEIKFYRTSLVEISDSAKDPDSTWYHGQFNKHEIGDRTRKMIGEL